MLDNSQCPHVGIGPYSLAPTNSLRVSVRRLRIAKGTDALVYYPDVLTPGVTWFALRY